MAERIVTVRRDGLHIEPHRIGWSVIVVMLCVGASIWAGLSYLPPTASELSLKDATKIEALQADVKQLRTEVWRAEKPSPKSTPSSKPPPNKPRWKFWDRDSRYDVNCTCGNYATGVRR